jgi:uncharacterized membrane protein YebE (DUF533 family)
VNGDALVNAVLGSVLNGKGKQSRKALRYLTGKKGGSLVNAGTLLGAAGVAWGIYETWQRGREPAAAAPAAGAAQPPPVPQPLAAPPPALMSDPLRVVRLAISAAHADGSLTDEERAAIVREAHRAGAGDLVQSEFERVHPLPSIVAGVTDPAQRATLYVLAFAIIRGDEQVGGAERIYLAQLANLLGLDADTVKGLEKTTIEQVDRAE